MAKILFIYPNMYSALSISPAIAILSAVLKREGHHVALIHFHNELGFRFDPDNGGSLKRVEAHVRKVTPDLVAVTSTSFEYEAMNTLVGFLREQGLCVPMVLGGAHATFCPDDFLGSNFDAFCVGEGERPLSELCRRIDNGYRGDDLFHELPSWLSKSVYPLDMPDPIPLFDQVDDLDTLPLMDRELFDMDTIIRSRSGWVDVFTARGCPFPCAFCCNHVFKRVYRRSKGVPRGYRQRSVESVVEEIRGLHHRYGDRLRVVSFQEDFLDYDREWICRFCEHYGTEIGLPFYMCSRPDWIDEAIAHFLKRAGCWEVSLGIESGSEIIRNRVLRKSISTESIYRACRCLKDEGIRIFANIMLGAPHENHRSLQETVNLLARVRPTLIRPTILIPLRGTDLHNYCRERNLLRREPSGMHSLFEESVLHFDDFSSLELFRYRNLLGWYVNIAMNNAGSPVYSALIVIVEDVPLGRWRDSDFMDSLVDLDTQVSQCMMAQGIEHYRFFFGKREIEQLTHVKRFELWQPTNS